MRVRARSSKIKTRKTSIFRIRENCAPRKFPAIRVRMHYIMYVLYKWIVCMYVHVCMYCSACSSQVQSRKRLRTNYMWVCHNYSFIHSIPFHSARPSHWLPDHRCSMDQLITMRAFRLRPPLPAPTLQIKGIMIILRLVKHILRYRPHMYNTISK